MTFITPRMTVITPRNPVRDAVFECLDDMAHDRYHPRFFTKADLLESLRSWVKWRGYTADDAMMWRYAKEWMRSN